ncbi:amidohydrolase family protein [Longimicrobium sp.]|uniref:amidohydrolase family protein n=1 Tax=Longimicrobium sp. TaxID=2029185 RepID=UPI003B3BA0AA
MKRILAPLAAALVLAAPLAGQPGQPAADHHLHLLSPAIVELFAEAPPVPVALPPELDRVLRERERIAGTTEAADVFTDDALVVDNGETTWSRGQEAARATASQQRPGYRIIPLHYRVDGASAYVTATTRRGEGAAVRYTANVLYALRRGDDGVWRIAAENASVKSPARFNAPFLADSLVRLLDAAGIRRGVVLSLGYIFGSPLRATGPDEYDRVRAENDWTAEQVARHPDRLVGFCSVNPLRQYAVRELERCTRNPRMRGLKLHFGNSAIDVRNPEHVQAVRRVFQAANQARIPIVAHLWTVDPAYGAEHSEIFLDQIASAAPDIPIQIAHMGASGPGYHSDEAIGVFADAAQAGDPRVRNLWFDFATLISADLTDAQVELATRRLRQLGVERLLFGSDLDPAVPPRRAWTDFRVMLPLTDAEFAAIADNVAPYLR